MKKIPIGISDFKTMIEKDYAYIDKTLLIKEIVEKGEGKISLIPRMRRFGKTLNLSMLRYFFEKTDEDTSHLFTPFAIWKEEKYRAMQGQYPVIFITLKDIKCRNWEVTFDLIRDVIAEEFRRHKYLLQGEILDPDEKESFRTILNKEGTPSLYMPTLRKLSNWLYRYHKKNVILLIDEYDAPAHSGFINGFYDELITFLRNWLSAGLKDNDFLEFGVVTGILRITKESIFSGVNNVTPYTLFEKDFQDKFGLTEEEVEGLLKEYNLQEKLPEIRKWYNGYHIGVLSGIYNPWSVLNCIEREGRLDSYWVNTSGNELIKELLQRGSEELKKDLEQLIQGRAIQKVVNEGIVFSDIEKNDATIWSLFLFTGYLTFEKWSTSEKPCSLKIPNLEVQKLYESFIRQWFEDQFQSSKYHLLLESLTTGNIPTFSELFEDFVMATFSMYDITQSEPEKVYHAFVLGMLTGLKGSYEVKSNQESGLGRYDVVLIPKKPNALGIIMEFKKVRQSEKIDLETATQMALQQIEEKKYAAALHERGITRILNLGIAFAGKKVLVKAKEI